MKRITWQALIAVVALVGISGCADSAAPKTSADSKKPAAQNTGGSAAETPAGLTKLNDEDRKLAEAQKYCVIEQDSLLGSMGAPIKLTIKDQTVFVCCKMCTKEANANPDKTLAALDTLKKKAKEGATK